MSDTLSPLEAAEILEHPEKHLQGKISVQPSLLRGAPDCVGGKIGFSQEYWGAVNQAASYLRAIAAGEYKPVVHGRWIKQDCQGDYGLCSECGCRIPWIPKNYKFCPSCGALMGKDDSR